MNHESAFKSLRIHDPPTSWHKIDDFVRIDIKISGGGWKLNGGYIKWRDNYCSFRNSCKNWCDRYWQDIQMLKRKRCQWNVCSHWCGTIEHVEVAIIIMLAYLYCAAYIRMTMNESSPPCEQRRITFNDEEQRVQLARPELPAPHYIRMYRLLPTTPHRCLGIITPDLLPVPIYRPRKDG